MSISNSPCPRCSCYARGHFKCACGVCEDDYCGNCGRWDSLPPEKFAILHGYERRCDKGMVEHDHPEEEKLATLKAWMARPVEQRIEEINRSIEHEKKIR